MFIFGANTMLQVILSRKKVDLDLDLDLDLT
jgi:hypothetical protein